MALATAEVDVVANTGRFEQSLRSQLRKAGTQAGKSFNSAFSRAVGRGGNIRMNTSGYQRQGRDAANSFSRSFTSGLSRLRLPDIGGGSIGGIGKMSGAMRVLAAAAVAAGAALGPLLGFLTVIPAAIAGAGAAVATLAVAFSGVGEAIAAGLSGDMAKFNQALAGLAPAAQTVVRDIVSLKPAFDGLRASVQGAFFAPLIGQFNQLGAVIQGPIAAGMTNLASAFGQAAASMVQFFANAANGVKIQQIFDAMAQAVRNIGSAGGGAFFQGFLDLAAAMGPALAQIGTALGTVMGQFGQWMSQIASSGQAMTWFTSAAQTLQQLGSIAAAAAPGFGVLMGILNQLGGIVRTALGPLMTVFSGVAQVVGAVLTPVLGALQPILQFIGGLLVQLAAAAAPMIPVFAQIGTILGSVLMTAFQAIQPALQQLVIAFQQLIPVIAPVAQAILGILGPALQWLAPMIGQVFGAIVGIVTGALNLIRNLFMLFGSLLSGDWQGAWNALVGIVTSIGQILWGAINALLVGRILALFRFFWAGLTSLWTTIWTTVVNTARSWGGQLIAFVATIPSRIMGLFASAGSWLISAGRSIIQGLWNGLKSAWSAVSGWLGSIGSKIKSLKGPPAYDARILIPAGRNIMAGFNRGLRSGFPQVERTLKGLTAATPAFAVHGKPVASGSTAWTTRRPGRPATTAAGRTVHVNAPITLHSNMANPHLVARRAANQVARLAQA